MLLGSCVLFWKKWQKRRVPLTFSHVTRQTAIWQSRSLCVELNRDCSWATSRLNRKQLTKGPLNASRGSAALFNELCHSKLPVLRSFAQSFLSSPCSLTCGVIQRIPWPTSNQHLIYVRGARMFSLLTFAQVSCIQSFIFSHSSIFFMNHFYGKYICAMFTGGITARVCKFFSFFITQA